MLLKLSGESLGERSDSGIDGTALLSRARDIRDVCDLGIELGIVPGGGNIFRGGRAHGARLSRVTGDAMGMLATVINAIALADTLRGMGIPVFVRSAFPIGPMIPAFSVTEAKRLIESGQVGIFPGGTGNPYFTTDTAAALRALEMEADVLLKGTRVDGVFSADPERMENAVLYRQLSFDDVLQRRLLFMDLTATTLCRDNGLSVVVFNHERPGTMRRVVLGEDEGTLVARGAELEARGESEHD